MAKLPEQMTDEELDEAIAHPENIEQPEAPDVPEPKKEPKKKPETTEEETPVEAEVEPEAPEEAAEEEEETPPTRRETKRVKDLLAKYGEPEAKAATPAVSGIDYDKELEADDALKKRLTDDRTAVGEEMYRKGMEQAASIRFHTRLEIDAPRIEAKYPQLDKDSPDFKPEAANDINMLYLTLTGYDAKTDTVKNPDLRYSDFVESVLGMADDLASEKAATSTKNVAAQAAKTGLRPDGSGAKKLDLTKPPEQMTDEELDAIIAQAIPQQ